MSRKGKMHIVMPKGVELQLQGQNVTLKGPKGTLSYVLEEGITARVEEGFLIVEPTVEAVASIRRVHGLCRSLLQNMVTGVSEGFKKQLELVGVGFRAALKGHLLDLQLGFSHPTELSVPTGLKVEIEKNTLITISGLDKREVCQFAAIVRAMRKPEPYQGKGIRYVGEVVRRKAGKAGKK